MPECDGINAENREFDQRWLNFTIPLDSTANNNKVANCVRYAPSTWSNETRQCVPESFNTMQTVQCTEYVHASDERNIQTEVFIHFPILVHLN